MPSASKVCPVCGKYMPNGPHKHIRMGNMPIKPGNLPLTTKMQPPVRSRPASTMGGTATT